MSIYYLANVLQNLAVVVSVMEIVTIVDSLPDVCMTISERGSL